MELHPFLVFFSGACSSHALARGWWKKFKSADDINLKICTTSDEMITNSKVRDGVQVVQHTSVCISVPQKWHRRRVHHRRVQKPSHHHAP